MFFNTIQFLIILALLTLSRSEADVSTNPSVLGGSLAKALPSLETPPLEVTLLSRSLPSLQLESDSQLSTIPTRDPSPNGTPELEPTNLVEKPAKRIDLVKRMLEKTRHIHAENHRLRRRSPLPQNPGGGNVVNNGGGNNARRKNGKLILKAQALQDAAFIDGQEEPSQAPSLMSINNFINFCVSPFGQVGGAVIMNGKQQSEKPGCNGIPMGMVPDKNHLPSCKFTNPKNLDVIQANKTFTVTMAVRNLVVGIFTNPKKTYLNAPTQLDPETGSVLGHTHVVIQEIDSLSSIEIPDPIKFFFFKGIDDAAQDGKVSVTIDGGVPKGFWRVSSVNTGANHQGISSPIAQRATFDDVIYITAE